MKDPPPSAQVIVQLWPGRSNNVRSLLVEVIELSLPPKLALELLPKGAKVTEPPEPVLERHQGRL